MMTTPPPIGTAVKLLVTDDGECPEVIDAVVVTGPVDEPAGIVCRFVVRSEDVYFRVHDLRNVNPNESDVSEARRKWATAFLARCAELPAFSASKAKEAERILRGDA